MIIFISSKRQHITFMTFKTTKKTMARYQVWVALLLHWVGDHQSAWLATAFVQFEIKNNTKILHMVRVGPPKPLLRQCVKVIIIVIVKL